MSVTIERADAIHVAVHFSGVLVSEGNTGGTVHLTLADLIDLKQALAEWSEPPYTPMNDPG